MDNEDDAKEVARDIAKLKTGMKWVGPYRVSCKTEAMTTCERCGEKRDVTKGQYRAVAPGENVFLCHECLLAYYLWMVDGESSIKDNL